MITWLITFIVIGGLVAYFMTGSTDKAAEGAVTGGVVFVGIIIKIVLPIMFMIFLFRAWITAFKRLHLLDNIH
jgi:hypothetical protein